MTRPATPAHGRPRRARAGAGPSLLVTPAFLLGLWALVAMGRLPLLLLWGCLALSLLTFLVYARDKWAARRGHRRTAERTLHLLALLGGWPGALWAQQLLRHKSSKKAFRGLFHASIAINIAVLAGLLLPPGQRLLAQMAALAP